MNIFYVTILIFIFFTALFFIYIHFNNRKKNLVFSSVGDRNNTQSWTSQPSKKNFDLVIYYFGEEDKPEFNEDLLVKRKGLKFDNFYHFINHNNIEQYESIWVVDDDIIMDTISINKMFSIFSKYKLWLAQPSFSTESKISWEITRNNPGYKLRYTNFVECGVPLFSREVIPTLTQTFKDARTGYGVDIIWSKLLGFPKTKIAILDAVSCCHPKDSLSSIDEVVPRPQHLTQGVELLHKYGLLPPMSNLSECNTWDKLYKLLPNDVRDFKVHNKIK